MKKLTLTSCLFLLSFYLLAQNHVRETMKITVDQVPVAILQVFEKDFATVPQDGYWTASVEKIPDGAKVVTKPLWYAYNKRSKSEKIEIRFTPTGELSFAKGINGEKNSSVSDTPKADKKKIS